MDRKLDGLLVHLCYESSLNPKSIVKTIAIQNTFCHCLEFGLCVAIAKSKPVHSARLNIIMGGKIMASSSDGPQRHRNVEVVAEKAGHCRVAKAV